MLVPVHNRFYVIATDNSGNWTLQSFTLGGPSTLVCFFVSGTGFLSGLTFESGDGNLYGIADTRSPVIRFWIGSTSAHRRCPQCSTGKGIVGAAGLELTSDEVGEIESRIVRKAA